MGYVAAHSLLEPSCRSSARGWGSPGRASRRKGASQVTEMVERLQLTHTVAVPLRVSLSRRGLGEGHPRQDFFPQPLGPRGAGVRRGSWAPGPASQIPVPFSKDLLCAQPFSRASGSSGEQDRSWSCGAHLLVWGERTSKDMIEHPVLNDHKEAFVEIYKHA